MAAAAWARVLSVVTQAVLLWTGVSLAGRDRDTAALDETCGPPLSVREKGEGTMAGLKFIKTALPVPRKHWVGNGFHVNPVFADKAFTNDVSPFLMFDYGAPKNFEGTTKEKRGVGQHPHRGFETVTVAFQGEIEHKDSIGGGGLISAGDVQWMTAGRGIIHEEFFSERFNKAGGVLEMCQIWVNLPKKHKMTAPAYQAISKDAIPTVPISSADGSVAKAAEIRVIAGAYDGHKGAAKTFSPVELWDVKLLEQDTYVTLSIPEGFNTIIFVRKGMVEMQDGTGPRSIGNQVVVLEPSGTEIRVKATAKDTSLLVLAGEPLNEPIAARGPFVMNTQDELRQGWDDFYSGNFGK